MTAVRRDELNARSAGRFVDGHGGHGASSTCSVAGGEAGVRRRAVSVRPPEDRIEGAVDLHERRDVVVHAGVAGDVAGRLIVLIAPVEIADGGEQGRLECEVVVDVLLVGKGNDLVGVGRIDDDRLLALVADRLTNVDGRPDLQGYGGELSDFEPFELGTIAIAVDGGARAGV